MIKELNHIGLFTANMDVSRRFYVDTLGGVVIRDFKNADHLSQLVFIQLALGVIELIRVPADATSRGLAHVAYLIDGERSLDANYAYLQAKGMTFTVLPKPTSAGDGRLTFFKDYSGVVFELIQREENIRIRDLASLQTARQTEMHLDTPEKPDIAAFNHVTIQISPDIALICDTFYTSDLGFTRFSSRNTPDGRKTLYVHGSDRIELHETAAAAIDQPLYQICLGIEDCAAMRNNLMNQGVACSQITTDPDGARQFTTSGPDGERLEWTDRIET